MSKYCVGLRKGEKKKPSTVTNESKRRINFIRNKTVCLLVLAQLNEYYELGFYDGMPRILRAFPYLGTIRFLKTDGPSDVRPKGISVHSGWAREKPFNRASRSKTEWQKNAYT